MEAIRELIKAEEAKAELPLSPSATQVRKEQICDIEGILSGKDDRLLLIVGPCSADRKEPVMEYVTRLAQLQAAVQDRIVLIPRIYIEKPRTRGTGYKGMVEFPDPLGEHDINKGLMAGRDLLRQVLESGGFAPATELVYIDHYPYFDDLMAYLTIGARSVENPTLRMLASGLPLPVGLKNPTSGDLSVAFASLLSVQISQRFPYLGKEWVSRGNPYAHLILRGYQDHRGDLHPNYGLEDLEEVRALYRETGARNPAVLVDANHANSQKDYEKQVEVVREVMDLRDRFPWIRKLVKGFMVESYLLDGAQDEKGQQPGQSITDPCLGWEKSRALIEELYERGRK